MQDAALEIGVIFFLFLRRKNKVLFSITPRNPLVHKFFQIKYVGKCDKKGANENISHSWSMQNIY
jgi:hypothetical protein